MTGENKKAKEKDIYGEGVVFDSPALAAVKRMFNQLKRDKAQSAHNQELAETKCDVFNS